MSRDYEIGFIINPDASEEDVKKITTNIEEVLKKGKAKIESVDEWGRKKMAYSINNHSEGLYYFYKTQSPGEIISEVERRLKLSENVLRFIVLRLDKRMKKTNRLEKKWSRIDKFIKKKEEERAESENVGTVEKKEEAPNE